eukprot:CAMPEP_0197186168 /NCGR_PEP_ID=MMETSP1423-20130617/13339_1 /TAXON_ID=476441 /ORGANISM="Pseudo-nitzschia heimii, Strain UNC1101" /LENGTH=395 /DNA_ID=CAMNT_0042637397 /DNA_START=155 /DNA_END=1338 /DNA_ORIENTATION=+
MKDVLMEEVFRLLEEATRLEKSGDHRIEAATKYYESCYLMRQVVASAAGCQTSRESDEKTFGPTTCHLLEAKIDHYTTIARKLYFDEGMVRDGPRDQQQMGQPQHRGQPATSVIIGLLDDAISVITEPRTVPPTIPAPIPGTDGESTARPRNVPNDNAPVNSLIEPRRIGSIWNSKGIGKPKQQPKQQKQRQEEQQPQTSRWKGALAAIESRIHQRAHSAHSRLSKAVDLDEQHARLASSDGDDDPRIRAETIATYVQASELYLSAIQLGEDRKAKLETSLAATKRASSRAVTAVVQATVDGQNALVIKLKRLLVSALDRVEALKKEEAERKHQTQVKDRVFALKSSMLSTPLVAKMISRSDSLSDRQQNPRSFLRDNGSGGGRANGRSNSPTTV